MTRPLIVGIAGAVIVIAAIVLTFFIDREPDRPIRDTAAVSAGEKPAPPARLRSKSEVEAERRRQSGAGAPETGSANTEQASPATAEPRPGGQDRPAQASSGPKTATAPTARPAESQTKPATAPPQSAPTKQSRPAQGARPPQSAAVPSAPRDAAPRQASPNPQGGTPPVAPSFDIVRVNPQGDTVIAGTAAPNSTVTVMMGQKTIGSVRADNRGEWVLVPESPISAGTHELTVIASKPGGPTVSGDRKVVVVVPERGRDIAGRASEKKSGALALAVPKEGGDAPVVLQTPGGVGDSRVSLDAIDYGPQGKDLALSGRAPPGGEVRVYVGNEFVGRTKADDKGQWQLEPEKSIPSGLYKMRVDQIDMSGKVVARVELPFSRAEPLTGLSPGTVVFVQPGNSLWRLARAAYGRGLRYTVIFEANRDQIRDPDLIYPGQVFILPEVN